MRRTLVLSALAAVVVLLVSGAMLIAMGKPAQSQESEPPCDPQVSAHCLLKTVTPTTATVGEQITFTITETCPPGFNFCLLNEDRWDLVDQLPSGLTVDSVVPAGPEQPSGYECTTSGNTVTCPVPRIATPFNPFTVTIVATPTECGSFSNTASNGFFTPEATFTVEGCAPTDTTAPKVISSFPRNGGEVGPAANIRATFSEEMRPASVKEAFKLFKKGSTNQISAQVSYDAATDTATLNPNNNLRREATYKAVVSTIAKDMAGNRLDQNPSLEGLQKKVWFFEID